MVTEWQKRTTNSNGNILSEGGKNYLCPTLSRICNSTPEEFDNFKNLVYNYKSMFVYILLLI
jgi:hypothetical protein